MLIVRREGMSPTMRFSAIREEITKQQRFLAKREVRRQAEREAFRRLPAVEKERILDQRRREAVESASEWAAFHAEQSAEGRSLVDHEYEQAKSYLERIDAPLRWLPWILLICAPIASFWGQNQKVVGCYGPLGPMDRCCMVPRESERFAADLSQPRLWKCLFRLLDCFAGLGSDRTDNRRRHGFCLRRLGPGSRCVCRACDLDREPWSLLTFTRLRLARQSSGLVKMGHSCLRAKRRLGCPP